MFDWYMDDASWNSGSSHKKLKQIIIGYDLASMVAPIMNIISKPDQP